MYYIRFQESLAVQNEQLFLPFSHLFVFCFFLIILAPNSFNAHLESFEDYSYINKYISKYHRIFISEKILKLLKKAAGLDEISTSTKSCLKYYLNYSINRFVKSVFHPFGKQRLLFRFCKVWKYNYCRELSANFRALYYSEIV